MLSPTLKMFNLLENKPYSFSFSKAYQIYKRYIGERFESNEETKEKARLGREVEKELKRNLSASIPSLILPNIEEGKSRFRRKYFSDVCITADPDIVTWGNGLNSYIGCYTDMVRLIEVKTGNPYPSHYIQALWQLEAAAGDPWVQEKTEEPVECYIFYALLNKLVLIDEREREARQTDFSELVSKLRILLGPKMKKDGQESHRKEYVDIFESLMNQGDYVVN